MYKIFKAFILIIWIIDIFNIDFLVQGVHVAEFLDITIPLNFWFWLFVWLLLPDTANNGQGIIHLNVNGKDIF